MNDDEPQQDEPKQPENDLVDDSENSFENEQEISPEDSEEESETSSEEEPVIEDEDDSETSKETPLDSAKKSLDPYAQRIIQQLVEEEMKKSYLDYAMSVIVGRALPDVRDGLKPVHRRILYAMHGLGMRWNTAYKKCARIVGEVLGKYHPHGDLSVYDALVRMAQDFSLRYMLINGQGNFGSVDGDSPAAMRYTEARMARIADEMLQDIDKETISFVENFDGSLKEPSVLPSKAPNLLINGSSGIAVGMATNIPPHNLREVAAAEIALIDNPDIEVGELMELVPGPDFPTGGVIAGRNGIVQAYTKGRGRIRVKAVVTEEYEEKRDKTKFIVTELPYQVNKAMLVEQIAECVKNKQVEGISDLRDESDRTGMRVVIELKKDATPEVVLNALWKHTRLQVTFGIINIALVNNEPLTLPLKDMLQYHIAHRQIVVRKRTEFDLKKAEERAHILDGLKIALDNIDAIVALIKKAKNVEIARAELIAGYGLDELQSNAILSMQLQRLTGLEQQKLLDELAELKKKIAEYKRILADESEILKIIKAELADVSEKYGDARRTQIQDVEDEEIDLEDLIEPEEMVVTISSQGYIKRMPLDMYRAQGRGGKGIRGATTKEDDFIAQLYIANTHDTMLFFTSNGRIHWKKVYQIPEGSRQSKGRPIINLIQLDKDEFVRAVIKVNEFKKDNYLLFVTRDGTVKKTSLEQYSRPRQGGIIAIKLMNDNDLVTVLKTNGDDQILIASKDGAAVKFHENDVRDMGRNAAGVRGIKLRSGDKVVGAIKAGDEKDILTVTENGYGKRTALPEYRLINRGGLGVRNIKCTPRNGKVVSIKSLSGGEEIMLASKNGTVIRMIAEDISKIGRDTQGVRVMGMRGDDKVVACAKIISEDAEDVAESEEE